MEKSRHRKFGIIRRREDDYSNEQKAVIEEYSQKYNLLYLSYDEN